MKNCGMIMRQPATRWEDGLPAGNGTVGALVYGNIASELVLLNHEALWLRRPKPVIPDVSEFLPACRELLAAGQYKTAEQFLSDKLIEHGYNYPGIDPYHPAFDLAVEMHDIGAFRDYRRALDFSSGEVVVSWQGGQIQYQRRLFVSREDDVVVMHIHGDGIGAVQCRLELIAHDLQQATGMGSGLDVPPEQPPIEYHTSAEKGWLTLCGAYHDGGEFGGLARVTAQNGCSSTDGTALRINHADSVLVIIKLFVNEASADALPRLRRELEALSDDYTSLFAPHAAAHSALFNRTTLDLDSGKSAQLSNEELLLQDYDGKVSRALVERVFRYGRYLLISSSRPGGLPANLQGVWNGHYAPAWASDFHNDENIQMNYWQALPGNLAEVTLPYFDYYDSLLEDYRTNARALFGCRGILTPVAQSTNGLIYPGLWVNWTAGAGWLAQLFYDYWLFTGDRAFLATRAIPFMKEVALFYEDFIIVDDSDSLMFSPSLSPENEPIVPHSSLVSVNATMDFAIARELLGNLCTACELLGIEQDGAVRWRKLLRRMPPYEINKDGALREWLHPDLQDNYQHRHLSHLYPLFPGFEITEETDPSLFEAVRIAVEKRLQIGLTSQTGWSFAHMANIFARLGEGNRALECLEYITRSCMGANLFTYHNDWRAQGLSMYWGHNSRPPFQIDANFGFTAAVLEMLFFSQPGFIKLLPALPDDWRNGRLAGARCRGGIEIELHWQMDERCLHVSFTSADTQTVTVKFPAEITDIACSAGTEHIHDSALGASYKMITLHATTTLSLTAHW